MTTKLLQQVREQDQAALAEKHNGTDRKVYRSDWVIVRMRTALPPHHIALANRLMDLNATAQGLSVIGHERIDGRNGPEGALAARIDAQWALTGYEARIGSTLRERGRRCFWSICEGRSTAEALRACGYAPGSDRALREMVQLVLINAQDYDDECRAGRQQGRSA